VVPELRRSDVDPSLAPVGAAAEPAGFWPEAAGYGQAALEGAYWQEPQGWRDWGPPPELHPDHPSAPFARVQILSDHPSGPMPAYPGPATGEVPRQWPGGPAGTWRTPPPDWRGQPPHSDSLRMAEQVLTLADGQASRIAREAQDYAASIREAAERQAAAITWEASSRAEAITQQAASEAAAIRGAAEQEAAAFRARLGSIPGELSRVVTAYVTETFAAPAIPAAAPALPDLMPAHPRATPAPLDPGTTRPGAAGAGAAPPEINHGRPDTRPARSKPAASPASPGGRPARPGTTPVSKPQKRPRQQQAMRIATGATATLLALSVIGGAAQIGKHGFKFFVFREAGVGQTSGNETDQSFLTKQKAAAHHAAVPKGRHHKKPAQAVEVHH
jgi:hypothetical protein